MILVTGAGGKTGRAVLEALQTQSAPTRALLHRPQPVPASETLLGNMADQATIPAALAGVEAVYFIAPNMHPHEYDVACEWLSAAKTAGVGRFIYHSVLFPQIEAMPHHWQKLRIEEALIRSGLDFTILQPASYMQNILPYLDGMRQHGEYHVPYSVSAPFSPVDLEDIAAAAAKVLLEAGHQGASYQLAGPETLSSAEMAAQVAAYIGRLVAAAEQPLDAWRAANADMPNYTRDTLAAMFAYYDAHGFVASSFTLAGLLGRAPHSFKEFLEREVEQ